MKLARVEIENYRAVRKLVLPLDPNLTILHGNNACGKTSVLSAIATGLGSIPTFLPDVSGVSFRKADGREPGKPVQIDLTTVDGIAWSRQMLGQRPMTTRRGLKEAMDAIATADREGAESLDLPILAFYDTDRAVFDQPQRRRGFRTEFPRYMALQGALSARTDFRDFFKWFYARENEELRAQRDSFFNQPHVREKDGSGEKQQGVDLSSHRLNDLEVVRRAIENMVPGASNPRVVLRPLRFVVSVKSGGGRTEELSIDQLSGGYRILLALAADLARRMAQGNPHLDDPLQSEAIVLIDEIELHLHPSWQQRVLADLATTFPNTQFIVSTHSPQVLTTIKPQHIVELRQELDEIVAEQASAPTYGAEAGDVLAAVMGVDERPKRNEFVKKLARYMDLVASGDGESAEATHLRRVLDQLSPDDPGLGRSDIEIRRHKLLKSMIDSR